MLSWFTQTENVFLVYRSLFGGYQCKFIGGEQFFYFTFKRHSAGH